MVLLVIDTQKGITDGRLYAFERFRENVKLLIAEARANGVEVVYVRHDDGPGTGFSLGDEEFEIFGEFAPAGDERIFDKTVNSALHSSTHLADYLAEERAAADDRGTADQLLYRRHGQERFRSGL